jgi:hypothetical protein
MGVFEWEWFLQLIFQLEKLSGPKEKASKFCENCYIGGKWKMKKAFSPKVE